MTKDIKLFLSIKNQDDLAAFLEIPIGTLMHYCAVYTPKHAYVSFEIPKKNGGVRSILAPNQQLKLIQKRLSEALYQIYSPKKITHGFIKGRSIKSGAEVHMNKRCVLNIDLKDFFACIHIGRVIGMFKSQPFNFDYSVACLLARLVCCNNVLPQGAPTSPIISNLICRKLDTDLLLLSSKYKILCTRYCDDITFSTKAFDFPPSILTKSSTGNMTLGEELIDIIFKNSFVINERKIRVSYRQSRQMVTGLVVNEKLNILRKKYKNFRALLHHAKIKGVPVAAKYNGFVKEDGAADESRFFKYLTGTINYYKMIMSVYDSKYQKLAQAYNELVGEEKFEIPNTQESLYKNYLYIIDNEHDLTQGTAFYVKDVGLVTCLHNVYDLTDAGVDCQKINEKLKKCKVYRPDDAENKFDVECQYFKRTDDLLLLKIKGVNIQGGYEIEKNLSNLGDPTKKYIAFAYPNYSDNTSVSINVDMKVEQSTVQNGQTFYLVDKILYGGASGGPVLNTELKVVGYICRGNQFGDEVNHINAFSPIEALSKYLQDDSSEN